LSGERERGIKMKEQLTMIDTGAGILPHERKRANTDHNLPPGDEALDDRPRSVYEMITRRMLEEVRSDLEEIKGRVNTLLWLTVGAVLVDVVMRLVK
jgi:hypothetical protein